MVGGQWEGPASVLGRPCVPLSAGWAFLSGSVPLPAVGNLYVMGQAVFHPPTPRVSGFNSPRMQSLGPSQVLLIFLSNLGFCSLGRRVGKASCLSYSGSCSSPPGLHPKEDFLQSLFLRSALHPQVGVNSPCVCSSHFCSLTLAHTWPLAIH